MFHRPRGKLSAFSAVSSGAKAILRATPVAQNSFPCVHEGFQEVYTHVRRKILDILLPVLQRQLAKAVEYAGPEEGREPLALPKIYVTGHSLGGSLAQLLALDLASNCEIILSTRAEAVPIKPEDEIFRLPDESDKLTKPSSTQPNKTEERGELRLQPPIAVYTFGQPRLGNKAFSRFYKQKVPHTFRVVNEGDAITSMPNFVFCSGVYKHAGLEVLLDEGQTGNILVGPNVVEGIFRFHDVRTSVAAHTMSRYRDCLESAFAQHELLEYYQGHTGGTDNEGNIHPANNAIPDWMTQSRSNPSF
jgi:hypothetical protein